MTAISELRRLSGDRTPLRWIAANQHIMNGDCYPIAKCEYDYDAVFICSIANNADALLAIAEAAKVIATKRDLGPEDYPDAFEKAWKDLIAGLEELEGEK